MATIRQRLLGADLRRLREGLVQEGLDLSVQQVAARIQVSESTIQRIERGAFPPKERVLRRMLELYGPDSTRAAVLIERWHQAKIRGWWAAYSDLLADDDFIELEETADDIRTYQFSTVPGLLQTEEYARATIDAVFPGSPDNLRRVELRVRRRTRFNQRENPAQLHVILDEAVVRRQVGSPEIWRDQLGYLKKVAGRDNITIQIVPFSAGEYVGMVGPRVLFGYRDSDYPNVACLETPGGDLYPEDERSLARFDSEWGRIKKVALSPEESAGMLADLLEE